MQPINRYKKIQKIQVLQNYAARILLKKPRYERATPLFFKLHWLPVTFRIKYKIAILIFKCLHNLAPMYLNNLIEPYQPSRNLRSSSQNLLVQKRFHYKTVGERSFSFYGPQLWNSLPLSLRSIQNFNTFKKKLKINFFETYYHDSQNTAYIDFIYLLCFYFILAAVKYKFQLS